MPSCGRRPALGLRLARAILVLPGTVLVAVPTLLLWWEARVRGLEAASPGDLRAWIGVLIGVVGMTFASTTTLLFARKGQGTPAPWDPPEKLVVAGPYRHVRNPMISGVLMLLAAIALLAGSWFVAAWLVVFFAGNALYFPLVEEKGLRARFGADYERYSRSVPRWIPRLRPWRSFDRS